MKQTTKSSIVYINLERVPERRKFMEKEIKKAGLNNVQRFSAIDAKQNEALSQTNFFSGTGDRWALPRSAIACFESHRAVWQIAVDQELDTIVVFEDDVLLSPDIAEILIRLMSSSKKFDVVKLDIGGIHAKCGEYSEIAGLPVRKLLNRVDSASGYILSMHGAKELLKRSTQYGDTLDDFIFTPSKDWRMYQLFPAAVAQVVYLTKFNDKFSHLTEQKVVESEREEDPEINQKNLSRGPIWFRIRKEFMRMVNKLIWKLYGKNKLISLGGYYGLVPINRNFETRLSKDE